MQKISNIAAKYEKAARKSSTNDYKQEHRQTVNQKWVQALFAKFGAIWGERWSSRFTDDLTLESSLEEWGKAITKLTPDQIRQGIDLAREQNDWPPTIAEFLRLAKRTPDCWEHSGPAYMVTKSFPKPVNKTKSVFLENIQKIKVSLGK